jgi:membrane protein DedA with SNARE-associated domain
MLFSLLMLGIVGLPIPEETLLTFCGYLIYTGRLHFVPTLLVGFCGSVSGITTSYLLGARFGNLVLTRFFSPARVLAAENQFKRFGPILLTIGYFILGVRHFTAVVAGMSGLRWPKFALFAYTGAALWVSTFLTIGYVFGERWQHTSEVVHRYTLIGTGILAGIALAVWLVHRVRLHYGKR